MVYVGMLAKKFQESGQIEAAISQLDAVGEQFVEEGKKKEAADVIQQILSMNPPNADDYRKLLQQIQAG